ncbi:hypothetical protein OC846_003559 [Tilletia horrida]|uniref:Uncharacterized protein n=1 Tax=Tilletia horrida TaxID=155126 RepID=A0AAN6JXU8_9BASI|nr:hypothetical protein OC845_003831 [Tilletia horrida]KAK0550702.1 hypothetical protein OC846_003559 [Tilletia horrida]
MRFQVEHIPHGGTHDDADDGGSSSAREAKATPPIICWNEDASSESLDDFLKTNVPSKVEESLDGWVWIRSARNPHANIGERERDEFEDKVAEAIELEAQVRQKAQSILDDKTVPARTSKKGLGRKDLLREQEELLLKGLKKISKSTPLLATGKWMWFEHPDKVDMIFSILARSLIDGPLARLGYDTEKKRPVVHTLKAATAGSAKLDQDNRGRTHLICLYFDSIWDEADARQVLHTLLSYHGLTVPSAAKADLYTYVGLTSSHPTRARSSNWRPIELIMTDEQQELKDLFWNTRKGRRTWEDGEKAEQERWRQAVGGRGSLGVGSSKTDGAGPTGKGKQKEQASVKNEETETVLPAKAEPGHGLKVKAEPDERGQVAHSASNSTPRVKKEDNSDSEMEDAEPDARPDIDSSQSTAADVEKSPSTSHRQEDATGFRYPLPKSSPPPLNRISPLEKPLKRLKVVPGPRNLSMFRRERIPDDSSDDEAPAKPDLKSARRNQVHVKRERGVDESGSSHSSSAAKRARKR